MGYRLGIDIGGTFTDCILMDEKGDFQIMKVPSTPEDQSIGIMEGWTKLKLSPETLDLFIHGSTIATNAIVERKGASVAHITTKGMRDVLEIHRADRPDPFNIHGTVPPPIIRRKDIFEVEERIREDGSVKVSLNEDDASRVAQIIKRRGYEAVSITFLHSYRNSAHERRVREILLEICPNIAISISSECLPQFREFERTSTTCCNAFLIPILQRYLNGLLSKIRDVGYKREVLIMESSGGLMTVEECLRSPAKTVMSGPAGGAVAASRMAKEIESKSIISLDMGGTSTDICLIRDGEARWTHEQQFSWGVPIRFPSLDMVTIGAGGGSIAWIDPIAGTLKVGPKSAGAVPGPACYDRGGTEPTTTDAQVVLGRLDPQKFLGGEMKIKPELSLKTIKEKIADPFGMDIYEAAKGILQVNIDNTMRAMRLATVERGYDPREFSLMVFGGGGPMYGTDLANELLIAKVFVPLRPGIFSAIGMVFSDIKYDVSRTLLIEEEDLDWEVVERNFSEMEKDLARVLDRSGISPEKGLFQRFVDLRYQEQGYEISIPMDHSGFNYESFGAAKEKFHTEHLRAYGYCDQSIPLELVFLRVFATGLLDRPMRKRYPVIANDGSDALVGSREVYFLDREKPVKTRIYNRDIFKAGANFSGPAIVEQLDTTTIIPEGMDAEVDELLNIVITTHVKGKEIRWRFGEKMVDETAVYSSRRM